MYPRIIDIPPSSPSLKRTRETKEKLPTRQILLSRATEPVKAHGNTSLWRIKTMVVAGSVNFLMKKGKERDCNWKASILCRFDAKLFGWPVTCRSSEAPDQDDERSTNFHYEALHHITSCSLVAYTVASFSHTSLQLI